PGPSPPWSGWPAGRRRGLTVERVLAALTAGPEGAGFGAPGFGAARLAPPLLFPGGRRSAVLVALFEEAGEARVLLTRRSSRLRTHTGEVAFPGGGLDPGESPERAALREAHEEIGLDPAGVRVVGGLTPLTTVSSAAAITPVVGLLSARPVLHPNPAEVDRAFDVALAELAADAVYEEERWDLPEGPERPVHFFYLDGETVWGATARVLRELVDLVLLRSGHS
ncbi:MAG: NUDIX hydrolase, partial [Acidimicrobiales bacterium]